jgi:hypothetical protein
MTKMTNLGKKVWRANNNTAGVTLLRREVTKASGFCHIDANHVFVITLTKHNLVGETNYDNYDSIIN